MVAHAIPASAATQLACDAPAKNLRRKGRPDDALIPGSRVSSWRVETELGRGGMASVHAVTHMKFGKRAAIKIAHKSILGDSFSPQTFHREARIVHTVDHPGVIDVFATGTCDGRPYLVMEKLAGQTLGARVDAGPPMDRREAINILLELVDILRATHAAGVVHRDLKLDNVFITDTTYADNRRVKLLDWGVAHVEGEEDPFRGLIAGTLTYVAPEQIRGDALTGAADIYSLAVLAYHLLCRRAPFHAGNDLALIHLHLRAEPPKPSVAWPECPQEVEALLLQMLAKHPEERPSLDVVETVLRDALDIIDVPPRFAEGSSAHIALPVEDPQPWFARWLTAKPATQQASTTSAVLADPFGRPVLPFAQPFKLGWACVAAGIAVGAGLLSMLSLAAAL
ncbi:MAG TPA: serine/threonine-protein kinase [Kofleriaceae bacterium]|nr:serine/threonine-protein kinase [Kofleriaceae bacterium]